LDSDLGGHILTIFTLLIFNKELLTESEK